MQRAVKLESNTVKVVLPNTEVAKDSRCLQSISTSRHGNLPSSLSSMVKFYVTVSTIYMLEKRRNMRRIFQKDRKYRSHSGVRKLDAIIRTSVATFFH